MSNRATLQPARNVQRVLGESKCINNNDLKKQDLDPPTKRVRNSNARTACDTGVNGAKVSTSKSLLHVSDEVDYFMAKQLCSLQTTVPIL